MDWDWDWRRAGLALARAESWSRRRVLLSDCSEEVGDRGELEQEEESGSGGKLEWAQGATE